MLVAIIIGTHGNLAGELMKSSEMICGLRCNIAAVGFEPGESVDGLVNRYQDALSQLDLTDGVLFLTDLFGGSPYNAACRIAVRNPNTSIVTGVNLPMLLEVCQLAGTSLVELVNIVQSAGKEGIRIFQQVVPQHGKEEEL